MGLDMCLRFLPKIDDLTFPEMVKLDHKVMDDKLNKKEKELAASYIHVQGEFVKWYSISTEIGYWRKSNQIHNWFVENVQGGDDDCGYYEVSKEKLIELLNDCQKVLTNRECAPDIFPTIKGFGFGSVEYDEYYFKDLIETVRIVRKALNLLNKNNDIYIYYHSSW